ncbi:MAG TPA: DUF4214 domain-containing protein [Noviherbaspirillum sp.]|jgi:hypothetical protein|nr:DUF4214 domain-containing protein [Noviherbaspirillum sp.]
MRAVVTLYQTVLHRTWDEAGVDNWVGALEDSKVPLTRTQVLIGFLSATNTSLNVLPIMASSWQLALWRRNRAGLPEVATIA